MTLEEIYFISQIVAVFAVIASLVFVGFQVRDSSRAVRARDCAGGARQLRRLIHGVHEQRSGACDIR